MIVFYVIKCINVSQIIKLYFQADGSERHSLNSIKRSMLFMFTFLLNLFLIVTAIKIRILTKLHSYFISNDFGCVKKVVEQVAGVHYSAFKMERLFIFMNFDYTVSFYCFTAFL